MNAEAKQLSVEAAVLDVITYFAVFEVLVGLPQINDLLPVKASHLAVQAAVRELIRQRKVQRLGDGYGLTQLTYAGAEKRAAHREELLNRARQAGRIIGALPFVKAVVVVNSVAIGNVHADSDIDLLIVTTPARVFVAKGLIWQTMKITRQLETAERKLVTLLLFGEDRFLQRLQHPSYESLRNRVYLRSELKPLNAEQVEQCVKFRLMVAGRMEDLFEPEAFSVLHAWSGGVCRRVNKLATLSLLEGYQHQAPRLNADLVRAAAQRA